MHIDYYVLIIASQIIASLNIFSVTDCFLLFSLGPSKPRVCPSVSEISGPAKTQTPWSPFYDEEDEVVFGSAEMDKTENKPLAVDNTVHGHVGYPSLVTPSSTIRVSKKRPINASSAADPYPQRLFVLVSSLLSLLIVYRRWWWWWETEKDLEESWRTWSGHPSSVFARCDCCGAISRNGIIHFRRRNIVICDQHSMTIESKLFV